MAQPDPYVSNGTCYYDVNQKAADNFIPCGNVATSGILACCSFGSFCLENNVCWDPNSTDTYLAGCTDKEFASSKCTNKGSFHNQQWVGLQLCDGNYKENENPWSGCQEHTPAVTQIVKEPQCSCDPEKALVKGGRSFAAMASLPTSALGTLTFTSGFSPSGGPPTPGAGNNSPNPGSDVSSSHDPEGLSSGAIAGIAVGSVLGAVIVGLSILLAILYRRKKKRQEATGAAPVQNPPAAFPPPQYPQTSEHWMQTQYPHSPQYPPQYPKYQSYSPAPGPESHGPVLSGFKSELAADDPSQQAMQTPSPQSPDPSQLYPDDTNPNAQSDGMSTISGLSSGHTRNGSTGLVSPQTTGSTDYNANGGNGRNGPATMAPINELQG